MLVKSEEIAKKYFRDKGWEIIEIKKGVGYDFCIKKGSEEKNIEVKTSNGNIYHEIQKENIENDKIIVAIVKENKKETKIELYDKNAIKEIRQFRPFYSIYFDKDKQIKI